MHAVSEVVSVAEEVGVRAGVIVTAGTLFCFFLQMMRSLAID